MKFMWTPYCTFINLATEKDLLSEYTLINKNLVRLELLADSANSDAVCSYLVEVEGIPTPLHPLDTFWHPMLWMGNSTYPEIPIYQTNLANFNGSIENFTFQPS